MRLVCAAGLMLFFGCGYADSPGQAANSDEACLADAVGELHRSPPVSKCGPSDWWCRAACFAGDGESCLGRAYALEQEPATEQDAARLFHRACLLGVANGCTNFAARTWARDHSDEELSCALRTFEKACAAKEPFACGMVGRVRLESSPSPAEISKAQQDLEIACENLGGFPCRVLAKHLEAGDLAAHDPERIPLLLKQACDGGDPDACGAPATASETFH